MNYNGFIGWSVVFEANGGNKVNKEGIALLSEVAILFNQVPKGKKYILQITLHKTDITKIYNGLWNM